jgi:hypothetical protein
VHQVSILVQARQYAYYTYLSMYNKGELTIILQGFNNYII